MAYDRQFLSVDFLTEIPGTDEVAVTGLNFSVLPTWSGAAVALGEIDMATLGASLIAKFHQVTAVPNVLKANYSRTYGVKIAAIDTNGAYLGAAKVYDAGGGGITGTAASVIPQSTVVFSLWSGSHFGTANYGRMYWPHTRMTQATNSPVADGTVTGPAVTGFKTFVNGCTADINAMVTDDVQPFIMSNASPNPSKPVLQVRVGNVIDTQRRRRNRLPEIYSTLVL